MSKFHFSKIYPSDRYATKQLIDLLVQQGIALDQHLDYTCGLYDDEENLVATGSFFGNTLRCLAVSDNHQGEGLLPMVVTHLSELLAQQGVYELFVYAKYTSAKFFRSMGFSEICTVDNTLMFMEKRANGFEKYLESLTQNCKPQTDSAAIIMNANPFTLGHQYLIETAAAQTNQLHLFVVSEDLSLIPAKDRYSLIEQGTAHLENVVLHPTESYLISRATFPSYFLKEERSVIMAQARLDTEIFKKIAQKLHITKRFLGEEPFSMVTSIYNEIMQQELEKVGITCVVIPRKEHQGTPISASAVRQLISQDKLADIAALVPKTTFQYFSTPQGIAVAEKIRQSTDVVHY